MRLWPGLTVNDVADMTPEQQLWHLDNGHEPLTFETQAEYERWLTTTK